MIFPIQVCNKILILSEYTDGRRNVFTLISYRSVIKIISIKVTQVRKYFMLLAFMSICTFSFSQKNYHDVVYLKNGSILQGTVIYQVPTKSIKIETIDGNVFFYQLDEVEEIARAPYEHRTPKDSLHRNSNGFVGMSLGTSIPIGDFILTEDFSTKTGIQINLINFGYLFSKNFGITITAFGSLNRIESDLHNQNPWVYMGV